MRPSRSGEILPLYFGGSVPRLSGGSDGIWPDDVGCHAGAGRLGELLAKLHGWSVATRNVRIIRAIEDLSDAELAAIAGTPDGADEAGDTDTDAKRRTH
jgi:hypothetical protein